MTMTKAQIGTIVILGGLVVLIASYVLCVKKFRLSYWQRVGIFIPATLLLVFLYGWLALDVPFWAALAILFGLSVVVFLRVVGDAPNEDEPPFGKHGSTE